MNDEVMGQVQGGLSGSNSAQLIGFQQSAHRAHQKMQALQIALQSAGGTVRTAADLIADAKLIETYLDTQSEQDPKGERA